MRQALRSLEQRARPGAITLALTDDEAGIVRPFTMGAAEDLITADRRPDTSHITIHLRTPVSGGDSLESIQARIAAFVRETPKPGRVEMETGGTDLVLLNPEQYRAPLVQAVTADGRAIAAQLGPNYGVSLGSLQRQVAWHRTGDLELTLFVPYELAVTPSAHP